MNLLYFIIFSLIVFLSSLIGYKNFRSTTLYALAIGGVVNANFFHAGAYPIDIFGLPFGIDSVIYTLFVFCVAVMFFKEGKKQAYLLAASSIIAIMLSAIMQLVADLLSTGSSWAIWQSFLTFTISSAASVVAIIVMIELLDKLKNKTNNYVLLIVGIVVVTVINSGIYYPLSSLVIGVPANMGVLLVTSLIGKAIALVCGLITLYLINLYENKVLHLHKDK